MLVAERDEIEVGAHSRVASFQLLPAVEVLLVRCRVDRLAWRDRIELEEIDTQPFRDRYGPNSVQLRPAQAAE